MATTRYGAGRRRGTRTGATGRTSRPSVLDALWQVISAQAREHSARPLLWFLWLAGIALSGVSCTTTLDGFYSFLVAKEDSAAILILLDLDEGTVPPTLTTERGWLSAFVLAFGVTFGVQVTLFALSLMIGERVIDAADSKKDNPVSLWLLVGHMLASIGAGIAAFLWFQSLWLCALAAIGTYAMILALLIQYQNHQFDQMHLVIGGAFLTTLLISVLFSFDSIYKQIQSPAEQMAEANAILAEETSRVLADTSVVLDDQQATAKSELFSSDAYAQTLAFREELRERADGLSSVITQRALDRTERVESELRDFRNSVDSLQQQAVTLIGRKGEAQSEITRLRAQQNKLGSDIQAARLQLQATQSEVVGTFQAIDAQIAQWEAEAAKELAGVQGANPGAGPRYRAAIARAQQLRDAKLGSQARLNAAQQRVDTLERDQADIPARIAAANAAIQGLDSQITSAEARASNLDDSNIEEQFIQRRTQNEASANIEAQVVEMSVARVDFLANPTEENRDSFIRSCDAVRTNIVAAQTDPAAAALAIPPAELTGTCWPTALEPLSETVFRFGRARTDFTTNCGRTQAIIDGAARGADAPRKALECLRVAGVGGAPALSLARELTSLQAEYGGRPNVRRSLNNLFRQEKYAVGAGIVALAIDLMILIIGVIVAYQTRLRLEGDDALSEDEQKRQILAALRSSKREGESIGDVANYILSRIKKTEDRQKLYLDTFNVGVAEYDRLNRFACAVRNITNGDTVKDGNSKLSDTIPDRLQAYLYFITENEHLQDLSPRSYADPLLAPATSAPPSPPEKFPRVETGRTDDTTTRLEEVTNHRPDTKPNPIPSGKEAYEGGV